MAFSELGLHQNATRKKKVTIRYKNRIPFSHLLFDMCLVQALDTFSVQPLRVRWGSHGKPEPGLGVQSGARSAPLHSQNRFMFVITVSIRFSLI